MDKTLVVGGSMLCNEVCALLVRFTNSLACCCYVHNKRAGEPDLCIMRYNFLSWIVVLRGFSDRLVALHIQNWFRCVTICSLQLSMVWMVSLAGGQWQEPGRNIPPLLHRTQTCNRQPGLRTKDKKILKISIRSSLIDDSQRMWKKSLIEKDFDTQSSTVQPRCSRHRLDSPGTCNHIIAAIISVLLSSIGVICRQTIITTIHLSSKTN